MTAMDWRLYDNALGRFHAIDKLSELQLGHTPYHFGYNNPVYFGDPTGLLAVSDLPAFMQTAWHATPIGEK